MENLAKPPLLDYRTISQNYFEKLYWEKGSTLCGLDEVGRGPLAGPLVAAAVCLNINATSPLIRDSKTLSQKKMLQAFDWICNNSVWAIGAINHNFIDSYSIVSANQRAMKRALSLLLYKLKKPLSGIVIDAVRLETHSFFKGNTHVFCKAESISISVAAASIVAKVHRDRLMDTYDTIFNEYYFNSHKGYGTKKHYQALDSNGLSTIHRKSFLKRYVNGSNTGSILW